MVLGAATFLTVWVITAVFSYLGGVGQCSLAGDADEMLHVLFGAVLPQAAALLDVLSLIHISEPTRPY